MRNWARMWSSVDGLVLTIQKQRRWCGMVWGANSKLCKPARPAKLQGSELPIGRGVWGPAKREAMITALLQQRRRAECKQAQASGSPKPACLHPPACFT